MHEYVNTDICPDNEDISKEVSCNYILSIQLSKDWFSYCILDKISNKYIALSSYSLHQKKSKKQRGTTETLYVEKLDELISQFKWLKNPFKEVRVIYVNRRSTLVPSLLFDRSHKEDYLDFVQRKKENVDLYYDQLAGLDVYNVYALPDFLENKLSRTFKNCKIFHYSSTLLMNVFSKLVDKTLKTQLFVNVQSEQFDLIISREGELIYFNTYRVLADKDMIIYLFNVIKQFKLDIHNISLVLMGEIEKESEAHKNICNYIRDVSFIERNDDFRYIDVFDDIPPHFFYNLLNANLCV
ncbi:MAG: DUF3822 family protein [Bacteroidales bacterium]|nr:DUF3822 family protein [Bacteroidales bacterium]